jgi:hypothetical protein
MISTFEMKYLNETDKAREHIWKMPQVTLLHRFFLGSRMLLKAVETLYKIHTSAFSHSGILFGKPINFIPSALELWSFRSRGF